MSFESSKVMFSSGNMSRYSSALTTFDIISQTNTNEIDFMTLQIHRSNIGTGIDQMYHNYRNILSMYFSPGHVTKIVDTPIHANPTNESDLTNSILYHQ